ncbi:hypothetical protein PVOR_27560 [Paenibacillus vortex V453]|uniref:Tyr recombinase domain-containing protein n=1 Tax=Paenibacillus vortex V453 TaxID=715225 RepID=A0A2R9SNW8_9BACL|nr:hypothetical protein B9D94_05750 [Paenibacillus sp. Cedars]EFU39056.1 hypothetical protein PVOR_27560 [Paenibacillus vortex V453]
MLAVEWPDVDHERSAIWIVKQITLDEEGNKIEGDVKKMLLRECGMDLKTIQERLQHTKMDTRANIYIHRSEAINRSVADQLEELNPKWIKLAP